MEKIVYSSEFFNILDTLECGQVFRFKRLNNGFLVNSLDKACYVCQTGDKTVIECEKADKDYFYNYFDLANDYSKIVERAKAFNLAVITTSANLGKGIRILRQDSTEMLFSFVISQNNNITRIKGIIERLCARLGKKKTFLGQEYFAFPQVAEMANQSLEFYKEIGLGYRAEYVLRLAKSLVEGQIDLNEISTLPTEKLTKELIKIYGVGEKVANCVTLFGFNRSDSFPVDTWIEKVYKQNFNGKEVGRNKICQELKAKFGLDAGYIQQYLFYYKRSLENKNASKQD